METSRVRNEGARRRTIKLVILVGGLYVLEEGVSRRFINKKF